MDSKYMPLSLCGWRPSWIWPKKRVKEVEKFEPYDFLVIWSQCPITNASQRAYSAQPHTDVEIMKFLVLSFLDEILSNLFVCVKILAIIIQQVCSNKTLLVWSIWPNLSQTHHKTPCYGPGSQLWRANGRGLYLALTTKFPTWCVEGVSVGTA